MKYFALIFFILLQNSVFLQQSEVQKKRDELNNIKNEIEELEKELRDKSGQQRTAFELVEKFNKQSFLLNKLINSIKSEEEQKSREISKTENNIKSLEDEISRIKKMYEKYVVTMYKLGKQNEWIYLLTSQSVNQALIRYQYLKRFSEQRKKDIAQIDELKKELKEKIVILEKEKREKQILAEEKKREENILLANISEKKKVLNKLKNDTSALKKEIDAKKRAKEIIAKLIDKIIEDERRAEEERRKNELVKKEKTNNEIITKETTVKNESTIPETYVDTKNFAAFHLQKGKMIWPVKSGTVIKKFGENKNAKLNTITINYGIDILVKGDLNVRVVGEGVVSAIDWIPGYGSVIIISHSGQYRTVYGHLGQIFVKEGDKLKPGQTIGTVGESLEGTVLHFEIWNQRSHQNPEVWLAKK